MKKIYLLIIGMVIIAGGVVIWQNTGKKTSNEKTSDKSATTSTAPSSISDTQQQYEYYKGEEYDRKYLAGMMAHHQGAIDMAKLALTNAKHQELKDLANAIVTAQTLEISDMTAWQKAWGYSDSSGSAMQDHGAMTMQDSMTSMVNSLKNKTGDEFDKTFLVEMIKHHQQAVDMSKPAATNASHQEVKTLASKIISAQTGEISKMRSWQADWGYNATSDSSDDMSGMHM